MSGVPAGGAASAIRPGRVLLAVWFANVAVAAGIAAAVGLVVLLAGGGTVGAEVIRASAFATVLLGGLISLAILRLDLYPALARLEAAAVRGGRAYAAQAEVTGRRLLAYPGRIEQWLGGVGVGSLVAGMGLGVVWAGGGAEQIPGILPGGLIAVLLVVRASRGVTRRALRPTLAYLPEPTRADAFGGSFARRVTDLTVISVALVLFFTLVAEWLRQDRERKDEWLDRFARTAAAIASSESAFAEVASAASDPSSGDFLLAVPSCDEIALEPLGRMCRAAVAKGGPATAWWDESSGKGYAVAAAGEGGVVLLSFMAPTEPERAPWALSLLAVFLLAAHVTGAWLGSGMGDSLYRISRALERLPGTAAAAPPDGGRCIVREIHRIDALIPALSARIAEMRRTEEQAIEALALSQRVKTQFLATMSHDLKGPLSSILGFSELLLRGMEGPLLPKQRADVELVYTAAEELLRIITHILDSAKLEVGGVELAREWVPSVELVTEAVRHARSLVGAREIQVSSEVQAGAPPVHVDRHRVNQILRCLVSNAVKFTEKGVITVRARVEDGPAGLAGPHLRIDVRDSGAGISVEDRERLFQPFHQIDTSSSRRTGGTGLGLYIAKSLTELHGGRIWFESEAGRGSVFSVALPIEPPGDQNGGGG